ncbi:MAG: hypothetical protein P8Y84_13405 [Desulfuromonadales bacterium]|jgi:hypothetical protein
MKKFVALLLLTSLCLPMHALSFEGLQYTLAFAGYQFGMSYDQASSVNAFQYTQYFPENAHLVGYIENLLVDETLMDLQVCFRDDKVYKILARFDFREMDAVVERYEALLGPANRMTKDFLNTQGGTINERIYRWSFPDTEINIVRLTSQPDIAILGFTNKIRP